MPSGGEQAGLVALGIAAIAAVGNIIDRLIARRRPGQRVARVKRATIADAVATERAELARERDALARQWEAYRVAVSGQLADCRAENAALRHEIEAANEHSIELRGKLAVMQVRQGMMRAQLRELGVDDKESGGLE